MEPNSPDEVVESESESEEVTHPTSEPSIVDLLQQDLQDIQERKDVFIPILGYEKTGLQARYRMPESGKELDNIARKVSRQYPDQYSRSIYTAIDTMINLCMGLYVKPPDLEEVTDPVELDPKSTGQAACFDQYLASILSFNGAGDMRARQIVKRLFGGNDAAIMNHAERLNRWLMNTKADLNAEMWQLSGE